MPDLRVFTFSPDWGLPSAVPFAIKLLAWLEIAGSGVLFLIESLIVRLRKKSPKA
jgi:hypothetical protein